MSIALFFITHEGIASNLLTVGESIIQKPNNNLSFIEVPMDTPVSNILDEAESKLNRLTTDDGLFFITDIYGSTPSNIAQQLATKHEAHLLSGVNLPMVIRLLSYRDSPAESLLQKALDGAHKGIRHDNVEIDN
ncbi:MAG: PTS sugar transporter subunit IIA [Gammaproteobacteria bacterium]